ncbi:MAG TPA: hypothetical protein HA272_01930 [Methanoregula sp.]|nr:hypothetical protein [Methanoregula sp.]
MKICYFCDFENYITDDFCERCGQNINGIRHEIFNIAGFIKQNYQLYALFGILIALYEYLVRKEAPSDQLYLGIFPLIIAFYLILHLTNKASLIIRSRQWLTTEELIRRESSFQFIIFSGFHILLIIALLVSLPKEVRDYMGFFLGMFIFLIFFSANYTNEQYRKTFHILVVSIFCYELFIFLFIIIPLLAQIIDSAFFAFYYTWFAQIILYLAVGGFLAYSLITIGYNAICGQYIPFLSILQQEREAGNRIWELLFGIDLLLGIILTMVIFSLKDLYAGIL